MSGWPTTRRHPRSMREAWQGDYADAIEHYRRVTPGLDVVTAVVLGVLIALTIVLSF